MSGLSAFLFCLALVALVLAIRAMILQMRRVRSSRGPDGNPDVAGLMRPAAWDFVFVSAVSMGMLALGELPPTPALILRALPYSWSIWLLLFTIQAVALLFVFFLARVGSVVLVLGSHLTGASSGRREVESDAKRTAAADALKR